MKTLPIIVLYQNNLPAVDSGRKDRFLTTDYLIKAVIENFKYENSKQQFEAFKLYQKLDDNVGATIPVDGEENVIQLEDAEFELVKSMIKDYPAFRNGIMWMPFMELFDDGK